MEEIYLVKYYGGDYDSYYTNTIFATANKSKATKYVTRFNRILKKWKGYYHQYEENRYGFNWIREEFVDRHFQRWDRLRNVTKCYYEKIPIR